MRLWQRLFLAVAGVALLSLLGFASWQFASFKRGFLDYLDAAALARLESSSEALAAAFAQDGWANLKAHPNRLVQMIDPPRPEHGGAPDSDQPMRAPDWEPPPKPPNSTVPVFADAPGPGSEPGRFGPRTGPVPEPHSDRAPPDQPSRPGEPFDLIARLSLVDANGAFVAGNPNVLADAPALKIFSRGVQIGALRMTPLPQLNSAIEQEFARVQLRNTALLSVLTALFAFAVAAWLARRMSAPLIALTHGAQELANGDYDFRMAENVSHSSSKNGRDEFANLARGFNRLGVALSAHRAARRQYGVELAHELRTPLSVLRGELQLLQDGVRPLDFAALHSLDSECARLTTVIDDLYELALADAAELEYQFAELDFSELVTESLALQQAQISAQGLRLHSTITSEVMLQGDARRLQRLLDNLLVNSRRYTDTGGELAITLSETNTEVQLLIEDSAPGVPVSAQPRLFERFYRVEHSRSRSFGGAGLGLAICQSIVQAHAGRIIASDSTLGGLKITVSLPKTMPGN